jgi:hypothetical protein
MSFLKAPDLSISEAAIANIVLALEHSYNEDFLLNYDNLDIMTNILMLDKSGTSLNYDMYRYVDETFINSRFFYYNDKYDFETYNDYLCALVEEYGKSTNSDFYGSVESHHLFFFSTLKKLFILSYSEFDLDQIDFYILE